MINGKTRGSFLRDMMRNKYRLTKSESNLLDNTRITSIPQRFLQDNVPFTVAGVTPGNFFSGQPYSRNEFAIADETVVPKFNSKDINRFRGNMFPSPEEVALHELGHVFDNKRRGISKLKMRFPKKSDIADEIFAERFKNAVLDRTNVYPNPLILPTLRKKK